MRITIITINYNNAAGLARTIESVTRQSFRDFEYVLVDGDSQDGSKEIIQSHAGSFDYWVSEKDRGIYHAMNKGIQAARGEYLLFLNSGDRLADENILEQVVAYLQGDPFIYGDGIRETEEGKQVLVRIPSELKLDYFSKNSLFHPSTFIRRDLFKKYGHYNESYKIVGDWDFFMKAILVHNEKAVKIPLSISIMEDDGISRKLDSQKILKQEIDLVLENYFPRSVISLIHDYKELQRKVDELNQLQSKNKETGVLDRVKSIKDKWKRKK